MIKKLNELQGNRTFLLVALVVLPVTVKAMFVSGDEYTATLRMLADVLQSAGIALAASKTPDAIRSYAEHRNQPPK